MHMSKKENALELFTKAKKLTKKYFPSNKNILDNITKCVKRIELDEDDDVIDTCTLQSYISQADRDNMYMSPISMTDKQTPIGSGSCHGQSNHH